MKKFNLKEALIYLKEEDDEISPIENPYEGDKAQGFNDALAALAKALFGKKQKGPKQPPQRPDPRLKQPPQRPDDEDQEQEKQQDQQDSKENKNNNNSLSKKEIDELIDKIKQERNKAEDVIDDAGDLIDQQKAEDAVDELDDLEKEAQEAKTESDANKIEARLNKIADFWDDEGHVKELKKDIDIRRDYKKINKETRQARLNAKHRNYNYKPMSIDAIVHNIVRTIKSQIVPVRDSSWDRYNPRSDDLGYIAPGRYTDQKFIKPKIAFYFDVSGSWYGNKIKIDMGHRIEEALKVLDQQKKIELSCWYFGTTVHDTFTTSDGGNSDAPIPHAIELVNADELDNVIIMTDGDPKSDQKLQVPGFAWLLFYDSVSESLAKNVSGKKGTEIVMIEHD